MQSCEREVEHADANALENNVDDGEAGEAGELGKVTALRESHTDFLASGACDARCPDKGVHPINESSDGVLRSMETADRNPRNVTDDGRDDDGEDAEDDDTLYSEPRPDLCNAAAMMDELIRRRKRSR